MVDHDVLALGPSELAQGLPERVQEPWESPAGEKAYAVNSVRRLRVGDQRRGEESAAERGGERATGDHRIRVDCRTRGDPPGAESRALPNAG
jgi:hypothetical protein